MAAPTTPARAILLHADDDVAVLVQSLKQGEIVVVRIRGETASLHLREALPLGHKIALRDLPAGHHVRKYGEVIGMLRNPVAAGEHVHIHNLVSLRG